MIINSGIINIPLHDFKQPLDGMSCNHGKPTMLINPNPLLSKVEGNQQPNGQLQIQHKQNNNNNNNKDKVLITTSQKTNFN
jgi:hypothetical protein